MHRHGAHNPPKRTRKIIMYGRTTTAQRYTTDSKRKVGLSGETKDPKRWSTIMKPSWRVTAVPFGASEWSGEVVLASTDAEVSEYWKTEDLSLDMEGDASHPEI